MPNLNQNLQLQTPVRLLRLVHLSVAGRISAFPSPLFRFSDFPDRTHDLLLSFASRLLTNSTGCMLLMMCLRSVDAVPFAQKRLQRRWFQIVGDGEVAEKRLQKINLWHNARRRGTT